MTIDDTLFRKRCGVLFQLISFVVHVSFVCLCGCLGVWVVFHGGRQAPICAG